MPVVDQPKLIDLPEQPPAPPVNEPHGQLKIRKINRQQTMMAHIDVDELIPRDHKARAIWELVGRLNLSQFSAVLRTTRGCAGRPAWDPQFLVSLWVYAYSEGIGSAREIERWMQWEPGLQWLSGLETVNAHTLSDFRVEHRKALDKLFAQLLAVLEGEGLVDLRQVMHDGTKIRAQAGSDSFRREKTLRERLDAARELVKQMGDPQAEPSASNRQKAARERAARERVQRLENALEEIQSLQPEKGTDKEKAEVRVSLSEPEARVMKHGDNAKAPSYNAQISTEAGRKLIVGVHLSQCSSDAHSLMPAVEQIQRNLNKQPEQMVVDGGFTNRSNIIECAAAGIDLVGSLPSVEERRAAAMKARGIAVEFAPHCFRVLGDGQDLQCPGGCTLAYVRQSMKRGDHYWQYQARGEDCQACRYQGQCCPKSAEKGRTVSIRVAEQEDVAAFRKEMELPEKQAAYRRRGEVAEFPNAWIKEKLGLRKFRVRGVVKAGSELLWACLTYNVMQWVRLMWRPRATA